MPEGKEENASFEVQCVINIILEPQSKCVESGCSLALSRLMRVLITLTVYLISACMISASQGALKIDTAAKSCSVNSTNNFSLLTR